VFSRLQVKDGQLVKGGRVVEEPSGADEERSPLAPRGYWRSLYGVAPTTPQNLATSGHVKCYTHGLLIRTHALLLLPRPVHILLGC